MRLSVPFGFRFRERRRVRRSNRSAVNVARAVEALEDRTLLSADWSGVNFLMNRSPEVSPTWFETVGDFQPNAAFQADQFGDGAASSASTSNDDNVYDWIVQFRTDALEGISSVAETASLLAGGPADFVIGRGLGLVGQVLARSSGAPLDSVLTWFSTNTYVASYELDVVHQFQVTPNDPAYASHLWGLENTGQNSGTVDADIDAAAAWEMSTGSSDIVVGVIDTGVDYTHPDLAANMWQNPGEVAGNGVDDDGNGFVDDVYGYDFVNNDGNPMDDNNHGTHVAGTIAAAGNNGVGIVGVNWTSSIMALKFLNSEGSGSTSDAVRAVNYATMMRTQYDVNIRVTNNSWGGGGNSSALQDAIQASNDAGILFVAAAGNDGTNNDSLPHYPSSYSLDGVVSVAATDRNDNLAGFSNYGATSVDLAAPGVSIYSTVVGGGYASFNGTSMATPHVAGVAALAWSVYPSATLTQIRDALLQGVETKASLTGKMVTGGRLNARNTLELLGMNVAGSTPAAGSVLNAAPTEFTIDFTHEYEASSVSADDFTVNSIKADSYTLVDANTIRFAFAETPVSAEGPQVMEFAAGVLDSTAGAAIGAWQQTFYYDLAALGLASATPGLNETVAAAPSEIVLVFNEEINAGSVAASDLTLSTGQVTGFTIVGTNSVRFAVDIDREGEVEYVLPEGVVLDAYGSPNAEIRGTFRIDDPSVQRYAAAGMPVNIPDAGTLQHSLEVPDSFVIADLDVEFDAAHTWTSDLRVFLIAPGGTRIELFSDVGASGDNFMGTILDDEAGQSITSSAAPFTGRFRPRGLLSTIDGTNAQGTWTLEVSDDFNGDTGTLTGWALVFTATDAPILTSTPVTEVNQDSAYHYDFTAEDAEPGDALTVVATTLPNWLTLTDHGDGTATLAGTPGNADAGDHAVVLEVRDGDGATAVQSFTVTVHDVNDAPTVLHPIADRTASEGWAFTFTFDADVFGDVDTGDSFSVTAMQADGSPLPAWLGFDAETRTFSGTPGSGDVGTLAVELTATDTHGASVTETFAIVVQPRVNAPELQNPIGTTFDATPQFSWTALDTAARYDLWVNDLTTGQSGVIRNTNVSGTSFTPGESLVSGHSYIWTVRGIAADGAPGDWAFHRTFRINASQGITLVGPDPRTIDTMPMFEWTELPGAERYDLWVNDLTTRQSGVIRNVNIAGTTYTHDSGLSDGHLYVWTVRGIAADGTAGDWAPHRYFATDTSVAPRALSLAGTSTTSALPMFQWTTVPGAATYDLWVNDLTTGQSGVIRNPAVGNNQWAPETPLPVGHAFIWTVRGLTDDGQAGQWAPHQVFHITNLSAPEIQTPTSTTIDATPTLSWSAVDGAARYDVWVNDLTTGQSGVLRNTNVPGTSLTPTVPFVDGHRYVWTVRAISNSGGAGSWAGYRYFTVSTQWTPVLLAPEPSTLTPTFQWTAVGGAATYELWINDLTTGQTGLVQRNDLTGTSWTANLLAGHRYQWTVRAVTDDGTAGSWATPEIFRILVTFDESQGGDAIEPSFEKDDLHVEGDSPTRFDQDSTPQQAEIADSSPQATMSSEQIDTVMATWPATAWWRTAEQSA